MTVLHFLTVHFYRIYKMVEVARIHFKTFRQKCGIYLNCYIWEIFLVSARACARTDDAIIQSDQKLGVSCNCKIPQNNQNVRTNKELNGPTKARSF